MYSLDLNREQAAILRRYLKSALSDLSVEIAGTDRYEYREEIKAERELLEQVMAKLERVAGLGVSPPAGPI